MKRGKSEESGRGLYMEDMGLTAEERKRALIGVITNVLAFAAIVVALRIGEGGRGFYVHSLCRDSPPHQNVFFTLYFHQAKH